MILAVPPGYHYQFNVFSSDVLTNFINMPNFNLIQPLEVGGI